MTNRGDESDAVHLDDSTRQSVLSGRCVVTGSATSAEAPCNSEAKGAETPTGATAAPVACTPVATPEALEPLAVAVVLVPGSARGQTDNMPPQNSKPPESRDGLNCLPAPPASGDGDGPRCVGFGIDTLELGFKVKLPPGLERELRAVMDLARAGEAAPHDFGGLRFEVSPKGAGIYSFHLTRGDWSVKIAPAFSGDLTTPCLMFRPSCELLWERGLSAAWRAAAEMAAKEAAPGTAPVACLSRIDLAADFQGIAFDKAKPGDFVGRAHKGARYGSSDRPRRRGRNREPETVNVEEYTERGVRVTGFAWGKRPCRVRVYNKSLEIREGQNAKDFFLKLVWKGVRDGEPVWRVEVQLSREKLNEIHVVGLSPDRTSQARPFDTLEGTLASLGPWWRYVVGREEAARADGSVEPGENGWLSWRVPSETDSRRARWACRDEWRIVREVPWAEGVHARGVCERARQARAEPLWLQVDGLAFSLMAINGWRTLDEFFHSFRAQFEARLAGEERPEAPSEDARRDERIAAARRVERYEAAVSGHLELEVAKRASALNPEHVLLRRCSCGAPADWVFDRGDLPKLVECNACHTERMAAEVAAARGPPQGATAA